MNTRKYYYVFEEIYKENKLKSFKLPTDMKINGYKIMGFETVDSNNHLRIEKFVISDEINKLIQNDDLNPKSSVVDKFMLSEKLKNVQSDALSYYKKKDSIVHNGRLLRMANELYKNSGEISIQKTRYFDYLCSNNIAFLQYKSNDMEEIYLYGHSLWSHDDGTIHTLTESPLSNVIGVSTLLITSDNYAILGRQGLHSDVNIGRLSPSGSGSSDFLDIFNDVEFYQNRWEKLINLSIFNENYENTFLDIIVKGMERELIEEVNIPCKDIKNKETKLDTKVIGYCRLAERGFKPEFFGITKINKTLDYFKNRPLRKLERVYESEREYIKFEDFYDLIRKIKNEYMSELSIQVYIITHILEQINMSEIEENWFFIK